MKSNENGWIWMWVVFWIAVVAVRIYFARLAPPPLKFDLPATTFNKLFAPLEHKSFESWPKGQSLLGPDGTGGPLGTKGLIKSMKEAAGLRGETEIPPID